VGPFQNAYGNALVNWSVSCGAADCGSLSSSQTLNETPTTYTAPPAVPTGGTVNISAISAADTTQFVSATIAITPQAQSLADGAYVFQMANTVYDASGSTVYTGVFVAAGGLIQSGELDYAVLSESGGGTAAGTYGLLPINGGSYSTTPDGTFQISLETKAGTGVPSGLLALNGVLAGDGQSLVAQIFGSGMQGTLQRQTGIAAPSGSFVFGLTESSYSSIAGVLNIDGPGSISGAGSVFDWLTNTFYGDRKWAASTVSAPDSFGRAVFKLYPASGSPTTSIFLAGYMADSTHIRLVETSGDTLQNTYSGYAIGQGVHAGSFTSASVGGSSFAVAAGGLGSGAPMQMAAQITAVSGGSLSGNLTWESSADGGGGGGSAAPNPITGAWTVDPTGRMAFSVETTALFSTNCILYLTGDGNGILLTDDTNNIQLTGQAFAQATGTLGPSALAGNYALNATQYYTATPGGGGELYSTELFGPVSVASAGGTDTLNGFTDSTSGTPDVALSGSFTSFANGILKGSLTGLDPSSSVVSHSFLVYLIDNQHAVGIQTDNAQLTLGYLERLE
jgi:hypothetical protein